MSMRIKEKGFRGELKLRNKVVNNKISFTEFILLLITLLFKHLRNSLLYSYLSLLMVLLTILAWPLSARINTIILIHSNYICELIFWKNYLQNQHITEDELLFSLPQQNCVFSHPRDMHTTCTLTSYDLGNKQCLIVHPLYFFSHQ